MSSLTCQQTVNYGDKRTAWGYILLLKARELAHYLTGKTKDLDFVSPEFGVQRVDSHEIRQKTLSEKLLICTYHLK
jgi:CRISP-associated protein Cas1